jgi:hypothetical protein
LALLPGLYSELKCCSYPGEPLLWIRDAAAYLNLTLTLASNELSPADFQHFSPKPLAVINKVNRPSNT